MCTLFGNVSTPAQNYVGGRVTQNPQWQPSFECAYLTALRHIRYGCDLNYGMRTRYDKNHFIIFVLSSRLAF